MAMNISNEANQNFYFGVSSEFESFTEKFDTSALKGSDIVLFLELDTKVIHYNAVVDNARDWHVYGEEIESGES